MLTEVNNMEPLTFYLIGCLVSLLIITSAFFHYEGDIRVSDILFGIVAIVISWVTFVIVTIGVVVSVCGNYHDHVVIRKKK